MLYFIDLGSLFPFSTVSRCFFLIVFSFSVHLFLALLLCLPDHWSIFLHPLICYDSLSCVCISIIVVFGYDWLFFIFVSPCWCSQWLSFILPWFQSSLWLFLWTLYMVNCLFLFIYLFFCSFLGFCPIFIWEVFLCLFILLNFPLVSTCCVYQPHLPVFKDLSTKYPVGPSGATLSGHSRYLDWGSPRYSRNIPCVDWVYSPVVVELQFLQVYWWVVLAPSVILLLSLMKMFIDIKFIY